MATKTLTWFLSGDVEEGTKQGPAFRMDGNYQVVHVWASAVTGPVGSNLIFDINEDGTSLFPSTKPGIVKDNNIMEDRDILYTANYLAEGSVITLDIDAAGKNPARNLTVQMDIEGIVN